MPNSLAHFGLQIIVTRLTIPAADLRSAGIGCVIPNPPWILQRVTVLLPFGDALTIGADAITQASLLFSLLLCLALALFNRTPTRDCLVSSC